MRTNLPYDLAMPLLDISPKEWKPNYQTNACVSMFIAAQFTTAKLQNQPRYPSTDEWITKLWDMNTMEFYSAIRRTKLCHLQGNGWNWRTLRMELENIMLSEISQSQI